MIPNASLCGGKEQNLRILGEIWVRRILRPVNLKYTCAFQICSSVSSQNFDLDQIIETEG